MDVLVMCGGRGTRLDADTEKPRYEIAGRAMVDRVLDGLDASGVEDIYAAVSPHVPETTSALQAEWGETVELIETPGEGYVADLQTALETVEPPVLTVAADLPLLAADAIDDVLDAHDGGSLSVIVPDSLKGTIGVSSETTMEYEGQRIASTGVNLVGPTGSADTRYLSHDIRFAVNVNYREDALVAESLLADGTASGGRSSVSVERARAIGREPHGSSDDPEILDFSANTNPNVPEGTEAVYQEAFAATQRYPAEPPQAYRAAAAEYVDCSPDAVVPTPGGLAAIRRTIELVVGPGDTVLVPAPSFGEYAREVRLQGGHPVFVEQREILDADPTDHALAIVCNPNNPTGNAYDRTALAAFADRCRDAGTVLLVDEAFLGFTDQPSLAGREGVVVARALTKLFGMPGIRAGFAVSTGEFGDALRATRRTWNLSVPALAVGTHCLEQEEFVHETRERVATERARMREALGDQFEVFPSDAPFLLFDVGDQSVDEILAHAREHGVALRDARTFRGLDSHIRVAVRLPRENDRLLEVLGDV